MTAQLDLTTGEEYHFDTRVRLPNCYLRSNRKIYKRHHIQNVP